MQNLGHQLVSRQFDSSRAPELHHKLQQIAPGLIRPAPGRARRCICEAARTCPINISPDHVAIDQRMQPRVKPRELADEFRNRLNDDPEPRQAAHGRAQRGRIHALAAGVYAKGPHQPIRHTTKQNLVGPLRNKKTAIIPQCLLAEVTIRFGAHIQRMMPSHVERQRFNCRGIAQIVQLLQKQNADDDMQILRRPPHLRIKMRHQLANRKIFQKMVSENLGPKNNPAACAASRPSPTSDRKNLRSVYHAM